MLGASGLIIKGLFEATTILHDEVHASAVSRKHENILALLQK